MTSSASRGNRREGYLVVHLRENVRRLLQVGRGKATTTHWTQTLVVGSYTSQNRRYGCMSGRSLHSLVHPIVSPIPKVEMIEYDWAAAGGVRDRS